MYRITINIDLLSAKGKFIPEDSRVHKHIKNKLIPNLIKAFENIFKSNRINIDTNFKVEWKERDDI